MVDEHPPAPPPAGRPEPKPVPRDSLREALDTIVTVVVVVLLLRTYVAEAFMIPTGSMATTLYGYQKEVICPQCHFLFPVNCSSERERQNGNPLTPVIACSCPNCRYEIGIQDISCSSGDRVLVAKYLYDWTTPQRLDVVVFKNPESPQVKYDPLNFIKRLVGLPGETIAIQGGDVYVNSDIKYPDHPEPSDPLEAWRSTFMYPSKDELDSPAVKAFDEGRFAIIRKPPDKIVSMRRPVYDNDHPAADLETSGFPPRWAGEADAGVNELDFRKLREESGKSWKPDVDHSFRFEGTDLAWLRYRHLIVPDRVKDSPHGGLTPDTVRPRLITDFLGYNTDRPDFRRRGGFDLMQDRQENWVGDLMLECELSVDKAEGQALFELAHGVDRFRARFDLASGECTLLRLSGDKEEVLEQKLTALKKAGKYRVQFANFDQRLTLWVDGKLPFGDGVDYPAPKEPGPRAADLRPASIGASSTTLQVRHVALWRDVYYTRVVGGGSSDHDHTEEVRDYSSPDQWGPLQNVRPATYYVRPGHYFCLGDNSPKSSDSRAWGLVPERLMLGRALVIYFPIGRAGRIR